MARLEFLTLHSDFAPMNVGEAITFAVVFGCSRVNIFYKIFVFPGFSFLNPLARESKPSIGLIFVVLIGNARLPTSPSPLLNIQSKKKIQGLLIMLVFGS